MCGAVIVMTPFESAVRGSLEGSRGGRTHVHYRNDLGDRATPLSGTQLRLARVCDSDSKVLREANRKLDSVQNALNLMALRGLAPAEATIGEDPGEERAAVENSERDAGRRRLTTGPWRRKAPSDEVD